MNLWGRACVSGVAIALMGAGVAGAEDAPVTPTPSPTPVASITPGATETTAEAMPSSTPTVSPLETPVPDQPEHGAAEGSAVPVLPEDANGTTDVTVTRSAVEVEPESASAVPPPALTASSAGVKQVDAQTYVWGRVQGAEGTVTVSSQVWVNGAWSRSQIGAVKADGSYVLELTYGRSKVGAYRYRVAASLPDGSTVLSPAFTLTRTPTLSVSSAGSQPVGATTYAWGRVGGEGNRPIYTEVWVDGRWSRSQTTTTGSDGRFTLPLTYGSASAGKYRYRVTTRSSVGVFSSREFVLTRTGWQASIRQTRADEVKYSYRAGCPVGPSELSTVTMTYRAFNGSIQTGTMIVYKDVAADVRDAFKVAFDGGFRIAQMRNPDAWRADDISMMAANNSSGFNCRKVVGNPYRVSPHSYGRAVDINPAQNPYRAAGRWYPNATYATNRPRGVIGMLYADDPMVKALRARGFEWYSGWDWHHFQK